MTCSNESPAKLERGIGFGGKGNGEGGGGWGEGEHSLVVLKKVSTTCEYFNFFRKKPHNLKIQVGFFSVKNVIDFFPKLSKLSFNKLQMTRSIKKFKKY